MDVLVPEETLEQLISARQLTPEAQALAYFRFFDDDATSGVSRGLAPTETERFYNRYYWFSLFAARQQAASGLDAGIEQQKFQMLETAPADVDWRIVERINKSIAV